MKQGMSLPELAAELEARKTRKRDIVLDTKQLGVLAGRPAIEDEFGPTASSPTTIVLPGESTDYVPTDRFHRQLGTHLGVDAKLYDHLNGEHPGLYDHLINGLLREDHKTQLVRLYTDGGPGGHGVARAFLSDRYLRVENEDLANVALPIIYGIPGAYVDTCNVSEDKLYLKVLVPDMTRDLTAIRSGFDFEALRREYGAHHMFRQDERPDLVCPGLVIENSEVGAGALRVSRLIFRVQCSNGMIAEHTVNRRHVGKRIGGDMFADDEGTVWKDDTLRAMDDALKLKVRDAVTAAVDETNFDLLARQFAESGLTKPIERPIPAMKVLGKALTLTEREGESALEHLMRGGDMTKFGAVNAITAMAQTVESFDRSVELETIGGDLLAWDRSKWEAIAQVA